MVEGPAKALVPKRSRGVPVGEGRAGWSSFEKASSRFEKLKYPFESMATSTGGKTLGGVERAVDEESDGEEPDSGDEWLLEGPARSSKLKKSSMEVLRGKLIGWRGLSVSIWGVGELAADERDDES